MIGNFITVGAICLLTVAIVILTVKHKINEEEIDNIISDKADETRVDGICSNIGQMSVDLDRIEMQTAKANDEINDILKKLNAIAEDIGRLDAMTKRDHSDLVDIRERYLLWREPVDGSVQPE